MRKTGFIYSEDYLKHKTGDHHPENEKRLKAIVNHLEQEGLLETLIKISPRIASEEELALVHCTNHISYVKKSCISNIPALDPDTIICSDSFRIASMAAGGILEAIDAVMNNTVHNAFCAVRPPGHHAASDKAMGFCLFNNVAIGARYLQNKYKIEKVLIVDWDVHHGNGTSDIFYDDPNVFYFSIHQYPHYPGTGHKSEQGSGDGKGTTMNIHFTGGAGDLEYINVFTDKLIEAAQNFSPDFILISAGFDCHVDDMLSSMAVTHKGFGNLTKIVTSIAKQHCNGKLVSVLEGGYNLNALALSVYEHINELTKD